MSPILVAIVALATPILPVLLTAWLAQRKFVPTLDANTVATEKVSLLVNGRLDALLVETRAQAKLIRELSAALAVAKAAPAEEPNGHA